MSSRSKYQVLATVMGHRQGSVHHAQKGEYEMGTQKATTATATCHRCLGYLSPPTDISIHPGKMPQLSQQELYCERL